MKWVKYSRQVVLGQGGLVCCTYLCHHMFVACRAVAGFDSYVQGALLSFPFFSFFFLFPIVSFVL